MFIHKVKIENWYSIKNFESEFSENLIIFCGRNSLEYLSALSYLARNGIFVDLEEKNLPYKKDSKLYTEFSHDGDKYEVAYNFTEEPKLRMMGDRDHRYLANAPSPDVYFTPYGASEFDPDGRKYYFDFRQDPYLESANYFANERVLGTHKLWFYGYERNIKHYVKDWLSELQGKDNKDERAKNELEFIRHLIRDFQPQRLGRDKDIFLTLTEEGVFDTNSESLSVEDETLLHYYRFLAIREFRDKFTKEFFANHSNSKSWTINDSAVKPLFIANLIEYLDDATDLDSLLKKATDTDRQVFVFCNDFSDHLRERTKAKIIEAH